MRKILLAIILALAGVVLAEHCPPPDRDLSKARPELVERFQAWQHAAAHHGWHVQVSEVWRSDARQACEYEHGSTWVHHSNHQDGGAVDIFIVAEDGSAIWDVAAYQRLFADVPPQGFGLVSGGCLWGTDYDHLQLVELQGQECKP